MNYNSLKAMLAEATEGGVVQIREDLYELIPESTVVSIIRKHHPNTKITNTLIERYQADAKNQTLTPDKVVLELRKLNPADAVFESHVEYRLDDGKVVVISEEMDGRLNKILGEHPIILGYMKESVENFMDVVNELED